MAKFTVYSKKNCSFCDRAVALLEHENLPYIVKKVDEDPNYFHEMKQKAPNMLTMPVITKDNMLIGGYKELIAHINE
tara:strand:- start:1994 stop:2224 length:231 start_codon:yes stop_codon:yes gene_type:complete